MPLTRRQAEAEGRKDEVEREYEEAIGHGKFLTTDKEEDNDNILGKHDLSSPEEEELRKKSRSEKGTEIQDESENSSMLMKILEELREWKAYTIESSKKHEEEMKKLGFDVNRTISEVHATREKLAEDEQTIQEMAKKQDQKMEDITSKNKFLCEHLEQFEVDVRAVSVKHDKYCEEFAKHINDHETDNKRVIDGMKESLKKHDISFENITKDLNDHETDNKRIIKELKEDLIVQQASIENENARKLKEIEERLNQQLDGRVRKLETLIKDNPKEINERLNQQLDGRVRKFEDLIKDNSKEITKLIATETLRENNYKLLNEDIKKLNIDMNLLKIEKSQNFELQNSLKTKMEEQGEKIIVLQQQNQYLMEDHRNVSRKTDKFATDIAVLRTKYELNISGTEVSNVRIPKYENLQEKQKQKFAKTQDEGLYTPAIRYQHSYQKEGDLNTPTQEVSQEVTVNTPSSTSNEKKRNDNTFALIAERLNHVDPSTDEEMIWKDMRNLLSTVTEHKPAYWDKVRSEMETKLTSIDILKPLFEYKRDGTKYQAASKGISKITYTDFAQYSADLIQKLTRIGVSLRTDKIRYSDWGIILRENFLDERLQQEINRTLKHHRSADNPWSILVILLFRNSKVRIAPDHRQEIALKTEPTPGEWLGTYLCRLTLDSEKYCDQPNWAYTNRIISILTENCCWTEMQNLRDATTYDDYLRNFRKIPTRLPVRAKEIESTKSFEIQSSDKEQDTAYNMMHRYPSNKWKSDHRSRSDSERKGNKFERKWFCGRCRCERCLKYRRHYLESATNTEKAKARINRFHRFHCAKCKCHHCKRAFKDKSRLLRLEDTIYEDCSEDEMDDSDNTTSEETDTAAEEKEEHDFESDDEQDKEGDAYNHGMFRMTTSKEEGQNNNSGKKFMVITLLDSGANSNFVYQAVIEEMKRSPDTILTQKNMQNTILYRLLSIEQTDKRHTVETADEPVLVNSRAMINVEIHSNESSFNFSAWFLILPRMKNMIILGKPSLFKLNYELQPPNKECFTIEGHKYYFEFTDAKGAYKLMELPNNSLLQLLKGTYPAVFTPKIPTSNTSNFTYKVILRNYPYNKVKPYPTNALQTEAIRIFVEEAVTNHIMEEQADDNELIALAPVFPVVQKDKTRVVTDFRRINEHLVYQNFPILPVQSLLQSLATFRYFTTIDLKMAYYHVHLDPTGDQIGVCTTFGNYRFTRLPFGLASSPAVFTRFIKKILRHLQERGNVYVDNYIDDIIIATHTLDEQHRVVKQVFQLLDKFQLRISQKKLKLIQEKVNFLGYVISDGKYYPDPTKVEALDHWSTPHTIKQWESFLGFINYLRNFIPNCSLLLKPMYDHMTKMKKARKAIPPPSEIITSFETVKSLLKRCTGLRIFNPKMPLIIFCDASQLGVGAVLMQQEGENGSYVPIAFTSRSFSPTQQRYSTLERELLAIITTLTQNRIFLTHDVTLFTDHQALLSLNNQDCKLSFRVLKFAEIISSYNIKLRHVKGQRNISDFISRHSIDKQPELNENELLEMAAVPVNIGSPSFLRILNVEDLESLDPELKGLFALHDEDEHEGNSISDTDEEQSLTDDEDNRRPIRRVENISLNDLELIKRKLTKEKIHNFPSCLKEITEDFVLRNGNLCYMPDDHTLLKVVSVEEIAALCQTEHEKFHGSPRLLMHIITQGKGWFNPHAKLIAMDTVRNCTKCDLFKRFQDLEGNIDSVKIVEPFSVWHLDFIGPIQSAESGSCKHVLHAVEYTTGLCLGLPVNAVSARPVLQLIFTIYSIFPPPKEIVSDNATVFNGIIVETIKKAFGFDWKHTSAYHPRANAKVEKVNHLIKEILKRITPENQHWERSIYEAIHIYNNQASIYGYTPTQLAFGTQGLYKPPMQENSEFSKFWNQESEPFLTVDNIDSMGLQQYRLHQMKENRTVTNQKRNHIRDMIKLLNDPKENHNSYAVGEFVMLRKRIRHRKSDPAIEGPFIVKEAYTKDSYLLNKLNGTTLGTYNVKMIYPAFQYYGSPLRCIHSYTLSGSERINKFHKDFWQQQYLNLYGTNHH